MLGALIGGVATLVGGAMASSGAKGAARTQAEAQQAAIDEQRRQFDLTRQDFSPYRGVGTGALNQLAALYGLQQYGQAPELPPELASYERWAAAQPQMSLSEQLRNGLSAARPRSEYDAAVAAWREANPAQTTQAAAPDFSAFYNSPDYRFALQEGLGAVQNSAAARGGLYSGNAMRALQERGAGIASQQFGNYTNRLAALAGIGQTATSQLAGYGAQTAGNIGNLMAAQGSSRASGIAGSANAWGNALGTIGGIAYDWFRNRPQAGNMAYNYTGPGSTRVV